MVADDEEETAMAWYWRFLNADGDVMEDDGGAPAGQGVEFPTQSDAESWIGEHWRQLAESGVDAVALFEDGREAYGPMSLQPPE